MTRRLWGSLPYLDALRPEPGWRTDVAVIATYSADVVAIVAALLALAGLDDERGSGSKVDFARAFDDLRDRVRVIAQAGRVVGPVSSPRILKLMDRFIRTIPLDEAYASWHPKTSLVRHLAEEGGTVQWRLWIGSRNLSRDSSWDVGLTLVGREAEEAHGLSGLPGLLDLGRELFERADLPAAMTKGMLSELRRLRWEMPVGCVVEDIQLLRDGSRGLPNAPDQLQKLIVVSPFLDGAVVRRLSEWGDASTRRILLSTQTALAKIVAMKSRPLEGYDECLYLDAPDLDGPTESGQHDARHLEAEDEEAEHRGLHAKLIYAEHAAGRTLWLGSANATARGWDGPNTEAVARLKVSKEVGAGLEAFVAEIGRFVELDLLPKHEEDKTELELEKARHEVASRWDAVLRLQDDLLVLEAHQRLHPESHAIHLSIGLLGGPLLEWPRSSLSVSLGDVPRADLTELVQCQLSLNSKTVCWIQPTPMVPTLDEERDRLAMARYLDPRTFLLWIRSLLAADRLSDGGGDWDSTSDKPRPPARMEGPVWWAPTIEEVLNAWSRDPSAVIEVDRKVQRYLALISEEQRGAEFDADRAVVTEFRDTWNILRRQFVEGAG